MSKHIKRIAAPKTWKLLRKEKKFVVKPRSSHKEDHSISIVNILRDMLRYADVTAQVKKILNQKEIFVDGKVVKDKKRGVGLMDVVSIKSLNEHYRMLVDEKGKLFLKKIPETESKLKICKIINKKMIKGNKKQYTLHDGRTIISDNDYNIGDSLMIEIPSQKILEHFKLDKNVFVYIVEGKYSGTRGIIEDIKKQTKKTILRIKTETGHIETLNDYALVLGKEKPKITI
ncbi:MAG: 30S ribosomal protein S4e [Candidatus Woesearchaeota archaeon]